MTVNYTDKALDAERVSVLVICFNQERFVEAALASVLQQTHKNYELIIVDDASEDNSVEVIQAWSTRYSVDTILIAKQHNGGVCKSINSGLAAATGSYIALLAADDIWYPRKLEIQLRQLQKLPDAYGVVYGNADRMTESGAPMVGSFLSGDLEMSVMPEGDIFETLLKRNFIPVLSTLIRSACFDRVGTYDESLVYEDWDFWLRVSALYKFAYTEEVLACYRVVDSSLSRSLGSKGWESDIRMYKKILGLRSHLDPTIRGQLANRGEMLYYAGSRRRRYHAWVWWRYGGGRPAFLRLLLSFGCIYKFDSFYSFGRANRQG